MRNLPVSLPAFAVFRTSQLPAKWNPPGYSSDSSLAETQPPQVQSLACHHQNEWATKWQRSPNPNSQTVQTHCCEGRRAIGMGSRDVWAKGKESFLAKWQQQRAQGRRSRVASRVSPQRRTVRPRRSSSFVFIPTGSFVHLVLGRLVYRPPEVPVVGHEVLVGSLRGKGASGLTERGRRAGSFRWRNEPPREVP